MLDLSLAKEKQQNFEGWQRQEGRSLPIEMTVQVLTTGFWPQYKVRHPPSVASCPLSTRLFNCVRGCVCGVRSAKGWRNCAALIVCDLQCYPLHASSLCRSCLVTTRLPSDVSVY